MSEAIQSGRVLVPVSAMATFTKRLAKLNKKAQAYGLEPVTVESMTEGLYVHRIEPVSPLSEQQLERLVPFDPLRDKFAGGVIHINKIHLKYPIIKMGQWHVIGKIERIEESNLIFSVSDDEEDRRAIQAYAERPIACEHCNLNRVRNDGFILKSAEDGAFKQVGSGCLKDFTGIDPAAALFLAKMLTVIRGFDELDGEGGARASGMPLLYFLTRVVYLAETRGFVSVAKARETYAQPTCDEVMSVDFDAKHPDYRRATPEAREAWTATAEAVRAWFVDRAPVDDFERNVALLLKQEVISFDRKHAAFAAAAVPTYMRQLAKAREAATVAPSVHIGKPGEKMTAEVEISRVIPFDTAYGLSYIVLLSDPQGNQIRWKTAAAPQDVLTGAGKRLQASFRIKSHEDYKGTAQTNVTHFKVQAWSEAA